MATSSLLNDWSAALAASVDDGIPARAVTMRQMCRKHFQKDHPPKAFEQAVAAMVKAGKVLCKARGRTMYYWDAKGA